VSGLLHSLRQGGANILHSLRRHGRQICLLSRLSPGYFPPAKRPENKAGPLSSTTTSTPPIHLNCPGGFSKSLTTSHFHPCNYQRPPGLSCSHKKRLSTRTKNRPHVSETVLLILTTIQKHEYKYHALRSFFKMLMRWMSLRPTSKDILGSRPDWHCSCTTTPVTVVQVTKADVK
jgi:hypothetical protein